MKLRLLLALPLLLAGCDCGGTPDGTPCDSDSDCELTQRCVDGMCQSIPDGGTRPDCIDSDGDGLCAEDDCDDTNAQRGRAEVCDDVDNDCDGTTDEGVNTLCADCTPGCSAEEIPGTDGWMPDDTNSEGVIVDDDGALTLGRDSVTAFSIWVANDGEATVSKLDSRTGQELARYPSVGTTVVGGGDVRPGTHNRPSRTAVDQNFDAYVANRAHDQRGSGTYLEQGSITKYANRERDCVDRNMNGMIDTSRDLNGDGVIDTTGPEYVGVDDECILWTSSIEAPGGTPRGLAIGLAPPDGLVGDVWVGQFHAERACRLDAATGAVLACMDIDSFRTYGLVADANNRIWVVDRAGSGRRDILGYIDANAMTFTTVSGLPADSSCAVPYGVTVDALGNVYMANQCDPSLWRYELGTDTWTAIDVGPGAFTGTPRGVAADEMYLWVASSHTGDGFGGSGSDNRMLQYQLSDLALINTHTMPSGQQPVGVGVSFDGSIWAICRGNDIAARFDPATSVWTEHPTGRLPYTYSDFIGFGLNVFAEPRGRYNFIVEGCATGTQTWRGTNYRAEVPAGTTVTVFARVADTIADLDALPWVGPFDTNPADFTMDPGPLDSGRYLQVELRLATTDRMAAPRIFSIDVAGVCEPIIE